MGRDGGNADSGARENNPSAAPATVENVTAVVLAAGTGARLGGCDKSLIQWRGRAFISHIVQRLAAQSATVSINTTAADLPLPDHIVRLPDPWPDQRGPLAGMLAGLEWSATPWVLFAPCDNPQPSLQLRQTLATGLAEATTPARVPPIAYATCGDEHHYLYALIEKQMAASLRQFIDAGGRSVFRWYAAEQALAVPFAEPADFFNVNAPADLLQLRLNE